MASLYEVEILLKNGHTYTLIWYNSWEDQTLENCAQLVWEEVFDPWPRLGRERKCWCISRHEAETRTTRGCEKAALFSSDYSISIQNTREYEFRLLCGVSLASAMIENFFDIGNEIAQDFVQRTLFVLRMEILTLLWPFLKKWPLPFSYLLVGRRFCEVGGRGDSPTDFQACKAKP